MRVLFISLLLAVPLAAQNEPCRASRDLFRRAGPELLRSEIVRSVLGAGRARLVRVACEDRAKDAPQIGVAYIVSYETGAAARVEFEPSSFRVANAEKLRGRPQSSEEEREEALALIVEKLRVDRGALDGGFVVDPPPGSPPGRYLIFLLFSPDRKTRLDDLVVDLGRRTVVSRRQK